MTYDDAHSVLRTPRARQLGRIGGELSKGGLMAGELTALVSAAITTWAGEYAEDLGDRVTRRIRVTDIEDDHIDVDVTLTGYHEPEHRYRITIGIQELEG